MKKPSGKVHDRLHVRMQWLEPSFERLECAFRLRGISLRSRVREVHSPSRIVVILCTTTHDIRV